MKENDAENLCVLLDLISDDTKDLIASLLTVATFRKMAGSFYVLVYC